MEDLSSNVKKQLHRAAGNYRALALALDKIKDIFDISLVCIFVQSIAAEFKVTEDFLSFWSMRERDIGQSHNIFRKCNSAHTEAVLKFSCICTVLSILQQEAWN